MPNSGFRFACDTGGTFTDLLVEADDVRMYKAATVPSDPVRGVLDALALAAADRDMPLSELLGRGEIFAHGTTHAINAIITGNTARTALLVTEGHPDILVLREGGKLDPFDYSIAFPAPYIPRALTFEVPERMAADGGVRRPLDEAAMLPIIAALKESAVEAVAVCLLWSMMNPAHEIRLGELLAAHLPGVSITLSHRLNPSLREYRRTSSAVINASLMPMMARYMGALDARLREAGFAGRVLVVTSQGGMMPARDLAHSPIHAINSGPSMAPVAGRYYGGLDFPGRDVIVADAGGTTYDISLVRDGRIPTTRETWIGQPYSGHMTGFPSVDVKSIGAGGGSIAWVDAGGLLHVGPQSAGAVPGPACFGRGGTEPTVTDACVALGYVDPDYFLGGTAKLDRPAARKAVGRVADRLGMPVDETAQAIIRLVTEMMAQAIADIAADRGVDPAKSVLLGCGGAAGLNAVAIARRLGVRDVLFPETGAALSAAGALMSDLSTDFRQPMPTRTDAFDHAGVERVISALEARCAAFERDNGDLALSHERRFSVEARYPGQVWEIEVPQRHGRLRDEAAVAAFEADFHAEHDRLFAIEDSASPIEIVSWTATAASRVRDASPGRIALPAATPRPARPVCFVNGWRETPAINVADLVAGARHRGPAILESPFTTIVVDPDADYGITAAGNILVTLLQPEDQHA